MKTEIIFVLDRSGSMSGLEKDVIGGFNSFIEKQKKENGEAYVTAVIFDHEYKVVYDHVNIQDVKPLTEEIYYPRGMTALLDAVGATINMCKHRKADHTIFMINTDGLENASKEFSLSKIKAMIEQFTKADWEFVFLGARIDAIKEAGRLGIRPERAVRYYESSDGVEETYRSLSRMTSYLRNDSLDREDTSWKEDIEENYTFHNFSRD